MQIDGWLFKCRVICAEYSRHVLASLEGESSCVCLGITNGLFHRGLCTKAYKCPSSSYILHAVSFPFSVNADPKNIK
jgi:hypothetical protein